MSSRAQQRQEAADIGAERCNVCGCSGAQTVSLLPHAAGGYRCVNCDIADHIGADVPSAPNDEQADDTPWWQCAHVLGHVSRATEDQYATTWMVGQAKRQFYEWLDSESGRVFRKALLRGDGDA